MAEEPLSTTRRALLGAAASLPVLAVACPEPARSTNFVRPERSRGAHLWNRRLARYRRLAERTREAGDTGFFRAANDRYDGEVAEINERLAALPTHPEEIDPRCGSMGLRKARLEGFREAAFRRLAEAEEAFWNRCTKPMQKAAVLLALTPAPDLPALLAKIGVMQEQALDELVILGRSVLDVLAEDVERLVSASP